MQTKYRTSSDWERFGDPMGMIRLILLVDWDPIGVFGHPRAMDEYDSYAVDVYNLLSSDASEQELVDYLRRTEMERMGVGGNVNMPLIGVAAKLKEAFDTAREAEEN